MISLKKNLACIPFLKVFMGAFLSLAILNSSYAQSDSGEIPTDEEVVSTGATLFRNNCAACHAVHESIIGPALVNVYDRRPLPWLMDFVKNSQRVIESGDEYAVNLYEEYNKAVMPSFDYFSEDEIMSILAYIKNETENKRAEQPQAIPKADSGEDRAVTVSGNEELSSDYFGLIFGGFILIFILILVVMILVIVVLRKFIEEARGYASRKPENDVIR
ncbi:cytochrome c [Marivirga sp. S37H4]|uniref:Cytochrome c n=1 Tax=Marivirga aurantiaca TaxID=2802615 RepID=A0A935C5A7_9BACT|nr:cytochrome c [Marivirga aurantiaca]MBK6263709.1 cytochrome c [Marivirga aurantiaca]